MHARRLASAARRALKSAFDALGECAVFGPLLFCLHEDSSISSGFRPELSYTAHVSAGDR